MSSFKVIMSLKSLILPSILAVTLLSGCARPMMIDGHTYDTYGILNEEAKKSDKVEYHLSGWSIFWAALTFEVIIGPIYFIGFDLYEPIGRK